MILPFCPFHNLKYLISWIVLDAYQGTNWWFDHSCSSLRDNQALFFVFRQFGILYWLWSYSVPFIMTSPIIINCDNILSYDKPSMHLVNFPPPPLRSPWCVISLHAKACCDLRQIKYDRICQRWYCGIFKNWCFKWFSPSNHSEKNKEICVYDPKPSWKMHYNHILSFFLNWCFEWFLPSNHSEKMKKFMFWTPNHLEKCIIII